MKTKTEKNRDKRRRKRDRKCKPGIDRVVALLAEAQIIAERLEMEQ